MNYCNPLKGVNIVAVVQSPKEDIVDQKMMNGVSLISMTLENEHHLERGDLILKHFSVGSPSLAITCNSIQTCYIVSHKSFTRLA